MTPPLVSCVIPCFNGARFLGASIDSALAQTHPRLEVIVVDDGSTDDSAALVAAYQGRVRYHRRPNGGPGAACNTGIRLAAAEFLAFLEQDDLWLPEKLERQLGLFSANPSLDYCVTYVQNFWDADSAVDAERYAHLRVMQPVPGYVVQTLLARRGVFERVGGFDETLRYACAGDWFLRAEEAGARGVLLPDVLTLRRLHGANFSRLDRSESRDQFLHVVKAALDRRRASGSRT